MTTREFYNEMLANTTISTEAREYITTAVAKLDAADEKRRERATAKMEADAPLFEKLRAALTGELQTTSALAAAVGINTSKATWLLKVLVANGEAVADEIKVNGKGTQKAYCLPND